jgi:hypothetical protein
MFCIDEGEAGVQTIAQGGRDSRSFGAFAQIHVRPIQSRRSIRMRGLLSVLARKSDPVSLCASFGRYGRRTLRSGTRSLPMSGDGVGTKAEGAGVVLSRPPDQSGGSGAFGVAEFPRYGFVEFKTLNLTEDGLQL